MWLFFGCRTKDMDLYKEEKAEMLKLGIFDKVFLALSREKDTPKVRTNRIRHSFIDIS